MTPPLLVLSVVLLVFCLVATPAGAVVGYRIGRSVAFHLGEDPRLMPIMFASAGLVVGVATSLLFLWWAVGLFVTATGGV